MFRLNPCSITVTNYRFTKSASATGLAFIPWRHGLQSQTQMCGCFKKLSDALPSIEGNSLKRFLQVHMHVGRASGREAQWLDTDIHTAHVHMYT